MFDRVFRSLSFGGMMRGGQSHRISSSTPRVQGRTAAKGPDEKTPWTRRHTPPESWRATGHTDADTAKKKKKRKPKRKGEGAAETKGPKTETGGGNHHKATRQQGQEPHLKTPPRRQEDHKR